jgi:hypothetical protein
MGRKLRSISPRLLFLQKNRKIRAKVAAKPPGAPGPRLRRQAGAPSREAVKIVSWRRVRDNGFMQRRELARGPQTG